MTPTIVTPFSPDVFSDLKQHVTQVRRLFDAPGSAYHDAGAAADGQFNRWFWHNPAVGVALHNDAAFIARASALFGEPVKPSYCFLSMYGPDGTCPEHSDRPQCRYTIDLMVNTNAVVPWPIEVAALDKSQAEGPMLDYALAEGQALAYSGTDTRHRRKPMDTGLLNSEIGVSEWGTMADLIFFHFVPSRWIGPLS